MRLRPHNHAQGNLTLPFSLNCKRASECQDPFPANVDLNAEIYHRSFARVVAGENDGSEEVQLSSPAFPVKANLFHVLLECLLAAQGTVHTPLQRDMDSTNRTSNDTFRVRRLYGVTGGPGDMVLLEASRGTTSRYGMCLTGE